MPILLNAISYPDEPGLREPDSLHFFRIFKEQPNKTYGEEESRIPLGAKFSYPETEDWWSQPGSNR
jgi:hypothetical protein